MSSQFRKKPVVIEAVQYRAQMRIDGQLPKGVFIVPMGDAGDQPIVRTIHAGQEVIIEDGDWIIPEPDGVHFYPCKPDIFAAIYEALPAPSNMPPHQQRVVDEKTELDDKLSKLVTFIEGSPIYASLPVEEQLRLVRQKSAMTDYSEILGERIEAFPPTA